jgi:hypothetical protein
MSDLAVNNARLYYDELGGAEWDRLVASPRTRVALELHQRLLSVWSRNVLVHRTAGVAR